MPDQKGKVALDPSRAVDRPESWPVDKWYFGDYGAGSGIDNLLLETGDDLLLETGFPDALILE